MDAAGETPLFCHRCGATLHPGRDVFYYVRITAVADPTPPEITAAQLEDDLDQEMGRLLLEIRNLSEQEAMNQVFRRLTIHLCANCYEAWMDNPTG